MKEIINKIEKLYPISDFKQQNDKTALLTVEQDKAVDLLIYMQKFEGFKHLAILTAVDWIENNQFQLSYIINNPELKMDLILRVFIDREKAEMTSIHNLWEQAATYQRELKEMFGINFPNSPRVDKPFILEGWDGLPPYRRDFDTKKYSEDTYFPREGRTKNNPVEYMKQKLYPDE
ncbi:MAG: NADH-quinone oxidoreductase subunit C [Bacteroidales bacterium]|nr:NADH-quinone oxidoreductase subunit C [Bacteroidales bacterium]MDD4217066.1 NADH-quinone oxidoreductase subunit C [Bacteroidales bacterium]MDY0142493.1 NADH-quinone oxidoreductase subunit C [Bacteroidales bacterium]